MNINNTLFLYVIDNFVYLKAITNVKFKWLKLCAKTEIL